MAYSLARPFHAVARRLGLIRQVAHLQEVARGRHRLAELDDHMLSDIGLLREQAQDEAKRPFWDAPPHFRRR